MLHLGYEEVFHLLGGLGDPDLELRIAGPRYWWSPLSKSKQLDDPMHVFLAAAAPKLFAECNVLKVDAEVLSMVLDLREGSHFTGAHYLVLVEQEDRNTCSGDEFVNLQAISPELRAGIPVD